VSGERISAEQAVAWARAHGAVPHVVDGSAVRSKEQALAAIGEALEFPEHYGRNLDALFDCLTDLSWLPEAEHVLVWAHHQVLAQHDWKGYQQVRSTLEDGAASTTGRRLTVVFTPN
jgi:RNAse (barnase) inhibitor barstar